jgi:phosphoribosylformimino-5-aminoimidazole carboxamide ribotide isomerase
MILYPAIDIRGGRVIRLREGDPNREVRFSDDPIAVARGWLAAGAQWLHVVNLDGAFAQANTTGALLERIAALGAPVQFGGGMRTRDDVARALAAGASRVVIGTLAAEQPETAAALLAEYGPERLCIGLDARDGRIATHGWQTVNEHTPVSLGQHYAALGARHALYTDVGRDGLLGGVDVAGSAALAAATGLHVIASGGVRDLADVRALRATGQVAGVVIGIALYQRAFTLEDALIAANGEG